MKNPNFFLLSMGACLIMLLYNGCCKDQNPNVDGCQKNRPKPDEHYEYWLGEAKDYMYFKHGTWWVYKNVQSGLTDSVFVTASNLDTSTIRGTETYSSHRVYTIENCRIVTKSVRYNRFYDWYNGSQNPDATEVSGSATYWMRNKSASGYAQPCFHTPFIINFRNDMPLVNNDTSLSIGSNIYYSVKKFMLIDDDTYMDLLKEDSRRILDYTYVYYAPKFGIIKYENLLENTSIELIRSNIIQ